MGSSPVVVVGVHGKEEAAVRFALREAALSGGRLVVLHAYGLPASAAVATGPEVIEALQRGAEAVLEEVRRVVAEAPESAPVEYRSSSWDPVAALEDAARSADVVVLGSDRVGWFERMLGGAVCEHVARHAPVPVVVVPEDADAGERTGGVVVALDGESRATAELQTAFEQAARRGLGLTVLHATPPGTTQDDTEAVRAAVAESLAGWSADYPDVPVSTSFRVDRPDEACLAATQDAALVVVGRPRHATVPFALARPVAVQLLRHARGPVAVVPVTD